MSAYAQTLMPAARLSRYFFLQMLLPVPIMLRSLCAVIRSVHVVVCSSRVAARSKRDDGKAAIISVRPVFYCSLFKPVCGS